jgi:hypothetical protein
MADHPYSPSDDRAEHSGLGTPLIGRDSTLWDGRQVDPSSRDDVPPMERPGMPLYNRDAAWWQDTPDPNVIDADVVDDKPELSSSSSSGKSGTVAKTGGK